MLKIAFITTVNRNPGDAFIREGIEYLIKQFIPTYKAYYIDKVEPNSLNFSYSEISSNKNRYKFIADFLGQFKKVNILTAADLIIQAGAPFYYYFPNDPDRKFYSNTMETDWFINTWTKHILRDEFQKCVFNISVGSCQPFYDSLDEFLNNRKLVDLVIKAHSKTSLTVVRDKVAYAILNKLKLKSYLLPCSSIFFSDNRNISSSNGEYVAISYMENGGHYTLGQKINGERWAKIIDSVYAKLKNKYRTFFVCHSQEEVVEVRKKYRKAELFFSSNFDDYLIFYSKVKFGIFNRIHGAMLLSGLQSPSIVVGTDSRAFMAEEMGLPVFFVNDVDEEKILSYIRSFENDEQGWRTKLGKAKEKARIEYMDIFSNQLLDFNPSDRSAFKKNSEMPLPDSYHVS